MFEDDHGNPACIPVPKLNATVRAKASCENASALLLWRQLSLFGKNLRSDRQSPLRKVSFVGDTLQATTDQYVRRVGRPKKEWVKSVMTEACRLTGGIPDLMSYVQNESQWKHLIATQA